MHIVNLRLLPDGINSVNKAVGTNETGINWHVCTDALGSYHIGCQMLHTLNDGLREDIPCKAGCIFLFALTTKDVLIGSDRFFAGVADV